MSADILINSSEYDAKFATLIAELEKCGYSDTANCETCPLLQDCEHLFDSLCDKKTHYVLTEAEYNRFMAHFRGLKKQLTFI